MRGVTADVGQTAREFDQGGADEPCSSVFVAGRAREIAPGADGFCAQERHDLLTPNMACGACTRGEEPERLWGHHHGRDRVWGLRVSTRIKLFPPLGPRGASRALVTAVTSRGGPVVGGATVFGPSHGRTVVRTGRFPGLRTPSERTLMHRSGSTCGRNRRMHSWAGTGADRV
jgi:hypothetical protein